MNQQKITKPIKWILLTIILFVSACNWNQPATINTPVELESTEIQNEPQVLTPTQLQETPTFETQPSMREEVQAIYAALNSVPEGEYLLVYSTNFSMQLVSIDGEMKFDLTNDRFITLLPNSKLLLIEFPGSDNSSDTMFLLNFKNGKIVEYPIDNALYGSSGFSPDGRMLALPSSKIQIKNLLDGTTFSLASWAEEYEFFSEVAWSPDGQFIAFVRQQFRAQITEPEDGLYLTDTSCLENEISCEDVTIGPIFSGERTSTSSLLAWSPDSRFLALASIITQPVKVYDTQTSTEIILSSVPYPNGFAWSPDGQHLAASFGNGIMLVDRETEVATTVLEGSYWVESWLTIEGN